MKLIIGLGNPGEKYKNNRHNVGYLVTDVLKEKKLKNTKVAKTDCFMNDSGSFVKFLYTKYDIPHTNLYVVFDDLDIKLGEYKIQFGKGPKDHNGLHDIYDKLGTKDFWHVRVGIDPILRESSRGEEIVLSDFEKEEKAVLDKVTSQICEKLQNI